MVNVDLSSIKNPRTPDGKWKDMNGCHGCGKISSAYIMLDIYQNHSLIATNIKLCKGCLCKGEDLIDKTILFTVRK